MQRRAPSKNARSEGSAMWSIYETAQGRIAGAMDVQKEDESLKAYLERVTPAWECLEKKYQDDFASMDFLTAFTTKCLELLRRDINAYQSVNLPKSLKAMVSWVCDVTNPNDEHAKLMEKIPGLKLFKNMTPEDRRKQLDSYLLTAKTLDLKGEMGVCSALKFIHKLGEISKYKFAEQLRGVAINRLQKNYPEGRKKHQIDYDEYVVEDLHDALVIWSDIYSMVHLDLGILTENPSSEESPVKKRSRDESTTQKTGVEENYVKKKRFEEKPKKKFFTGCFGCGEEGHQGKYCRKKPEDWDYMKWGNHCHTNLERYKRGEPMIDHSGAPLKPVVKTGMGYRKSDPRNQEKK